MTRIDMHVPPLQLVWDVMSLRRHHQQRRLTLPPDVPSSFCMVCDSRLKQVAGA